MVPALTLVRIARQLSALSPILAPLLSFFNLQEIKTAMTEIEILSYELENKYQPNEGLIFELWPSTWVGLTYWSSTLLSEFVTSNVQDWLGSALIYKNRIVIIQPKQIKVHTLTICLIRIYFIILFQAGWSWFQAGRSWFQAGQSRFQAGRSRYQAGRSWFQADSLDFRQGGFDFRQAITYVFCN